MLFLPVDEAYALDYFAILRVKEDYGLAVKNELDRIESFLKTQIPNLAEVLASQEFHLLYIANQLTFDAVAKCRHSPAQKANRQRFKAKTKLQERFWPKQPLTELKNKGD